MELQKLLEKCKLSKNEWKLSASYFDDLSCLYKPLSQWFLFNRQNVLEPSLLPWEKIFTPNFFSVFITFLRKTFVESCLKMDWIRLKELGNRKKKPKSNGYQP